MERRLSVHTDYSFHRICQGHTVSLISFLVLRVILLSICYQSSRLFPDRIEIAYLHPFASEVQL